MEKMKEFFSFIIIPGYVFVLIIMSTFNASVYTHTHTTLSIYIKVSSIKVRQTNRIITNERVERWKTFELKTKRHQNTFKPVQMGFKFIISVWGKKSKLFNSENHYNLNQFWYCYMCTTWCVSFVFLDASLDIEHTLLHKLCVCAT